MVFDPESLDHLPCLDHHHLPLDQYLPLEVAHLLDLHPLLLEPYPHLELVGMLVWKMMVDTDSLCDRCWFADAARLDDDIVEALHVNDVAQLVYKVHLQRAADAAVLHLYSLGLCQTERKTDQ